MARSCVFCGDSRLTKEHALPAWLGPILPGEGSFHVAQTHDSPGGKIERRWTTQRLNKEVRRVCEGCNTGWMSDLEGAARPILLPLIQGRASTLTAADQQSAATWAVKTAMMCELARLGERKDFTPATHHRQVFERRQPPSGAWVWVGGYRGAKAIGVYQNELRLASSTGEGRAFVTTMTVGALLMQTFWFWDYPDEIEVQRGWGLPQIWPKPSATVTLPPSPPLSEEEVQQLAVSFLTPTPSR